MRPPPATQILFDATGFPLSVAAFEGNKAETATMLPVVREFLLVPMCHCDTRIGGKC